MRGVGGSFSCATVVLFTFRPQIGPSAPIMSFCIFMLCSNQLHNGVIPLRPEDEAIPAGEQIKNARVLRSKVWHGAANCCEKTSPDSLSCVHSLHSPSSSFHSQVCMCVGFWAVWVSVSHLMPYKWHQTRVTDNKTQKVMEFISHIHLWRSS